MTTTLGALVLSSLLAQAASPSPQITSTALPSPVASPAESAPVPGGMPSGTAAPSDGYVRRGPRTSPRMNGPDTTNGGVTIVNSGSTNTAGYTIVVHPDFSADVTADGATETKSVAAPQGRWLFAKVRAAMPLGQLPGERCMKSASFGSSTTISYDGQRTPDLQCGGDATMRELLRTANVIVEQLQIPLRRMRGIQLH